MSFTCLRLTKLLFDDALRVSALACSGVSSTGLQPKLRLPAELSTSRNVHCVRLDADEVLHSTCKVDVGHIATDQEAAGRASLEATRN